MIEKIIIQDSKDVQSVWIPDRRSMASFAIWKGYGLGTQAHWHDGRVTLGVGDDADMPHFFEFPDHMDTGSLASGLDGVMGDIDARLPSADTVLRSLDADAVCMPIDPPAYRIPSSPSVEDAATCLLAARLLLAVRSALVPPIGKTVDDVVEELEFASRLAAMLGGAASSELAASSAADTSLCSILPDPNANDDLIIMEATDA